MELVYKRKEKQYEKEIDILGILFYLLSWFVFAELLGT